MVSCSISYREQYTGVWSGVFANTTEDSSGNIILDDGNATGSFSSGSFSCLGAGCNWTEIVWENNSIDDKAYGNWTLLDAFDDSAVNPALWTTYTSGDGGVVEAEDIYVTGLLQLPSSSQTSTWQTT